MNDRLPPKFSYFRRKTSCSFPSERLVNFFGHLWILSDPYEKSWHSQDENVTPIKIDGRYRIYPITRQRTSGELKSGDYFLHFSLQSAVLSTSSPPISRPDKNKSTKSPNYRAFSLTWSVAMPIYCHRRKFLCMNRVLLPQD